MKELDEEIFGALMEASEPLTVDGIAGVVERSRSTTYRSVQRLFQHGLVYKEQINYEQGGYHVIHPTDPDEIADDMQRILDDWYAKMGQLIGEFREKYGEAIDEPPAATVEN